MNKYNGKVAQSLALQSPGGVMSSCVVPLSLFLFVPAPIEHPNCQMVFKCGLVSLRLLVYLPCSMLISCPEWCRPSHSWGNGLWRRFRHVLSLAQRNQPKQKARHSAKWVFYMLWRYPKTALVNRKLTSGYSCHQLSCDGFCCTPSVYSSWTAESLLSHLAVPPWLVDWWLQ